VTVTFGVITQNSGHTPIKVIQRHQFWHQSDARALHISA